MRTTLPILLLLMLVSCQSNKENVDLLVKDATIYTVNGDFSIVEAFVIKDGRFIDAGSNEEIEENYSAATTLSMEGKYIYPGWNDPHAHFVGYGMSLNQVDLMGSKSVEDIIERCKKYFEKNSPSIITGRGWDQNDWEHKEFPSKEDLDKHFPDTPVLLNRVDGHAGWANSKALQLAGIDASTKCEGGAVISKNGESTGILIDNAIDLVRDKFPKPTDEDIVRGILQAEANCIAVGLTSVTAAGQDTRTVQIIDSLQKEATLKMRVNAWLSPTEENFKTLLEKGPIQNDYLTISTLKLYADGALGSRGARMIDDYSDDPGNNGLFVTSPKKLEELCRRALENNYQVATHAIGDEANRTMLKIYSSMLEVENDRRWRIEHSQIIHPDDFHIFGDFNIVPSIQTTHATSDMYWAEDRVGSERIKGAYSYKTLLEQNGWLPNGSDFPVEDINPLYGFYAAVSRQDKVGYPEEGFRSEEALTREEALKAMTIWAAMAGFEESFKGSIEKGKLADFIVCEEDIMRMDLIDIPKLQVYATYSAGEEVYSSNK